MLYFLLFNSMFSSLKKYELRGAKRRVRLFNRFRIESVLKITPYHTLKFGGIGKLQYLCIVIQEGCTRQSLSKLSSVLVCTFFALSFEERRKEKRKPARRSVGFAIRRLKRLDLFPCGFEIRSRRLFISLSLHSRLRRIANPH